MGFGALWECIMTGLDATDCAQRAGRLARPLAFWVERGRVGKLARKLDGEFWALIERKNADRQTIEKKLIGAENNNGGRLGAPGER